MTLSSVDLVLCTHNAITCYSRHAGTLLLKDGSHNAHERFFETECTLSQDEQARCKDHYKLKPEELPFFDPFQTLGLSGPAGSLFLWDSRTIHAVSWLARTPPSDFLLACLSCCMLQFNRCIVDWSCP
jgi:hypothetical protein